MSGGSQLQTINFWSPGSDKPSCPFWLPCLFILSKEIRFNAPATEYIKHCTRNTLFGFGISKVLVLVQIECSENLCEAEKRQWLFPFLFNTSSQQSTRSVIDFYTQDFRAKSLDMTFFQTQIDVPPTPNIYTWSICSWLPSMVPFPQAGK